MSFPKILAIITVVLFSLIGVLAMFKGGKKSSAAMPPSPLATPIEIDLSAKTNNAEKDVKIVVAAPMSATPPTATVKETPKEAILHVDRVQELFNKVEPRFPFVETITYKSRVSWQKGRPAWLSDYASHYATSRHFIARSLNGKPDYFKQDIVEGDKFNVLRKDMDLQFHLTIDISRCKLWLYCLDVGNNQKWLIKTYDVGLGRVETSRPSGLLTPLGKYSLGNKIAIYKPKMQGIYNGQKTEMIRVFGSRWIPFDQEISGCTDVAKGFGIHGMPWELNAKAELVQNVSSLGKYESDGCVRLATDDIEEIFAIIITKPSIVELVKDYHDAVVPGIEK